MLPDEITIDDTSSTFNQILDSEVRYSNIDLLRHVEDGHLLKRFSWQISQVTHLPANTVFMMGLAVFSAMALRGYCVLYPDGRRLPIGLYVVAEQPPGTGKSWCLSYFQNPFYEIHAAIKKDNIEMLRRFETRLAAKDIFSEIEQVEYETALDKSKRLLAPVFITNATPEALENTLNATRGAFAAISSEQGLFGSLLGGTYKSEASINNNDVILNGFDAGIVSSLRVSRSGYSGHAFGAVATFAQEGSVESVFEASHGTGVAERFIPLVEPHSLGRRDHARPSTVDIIVEQEYAHACAFFRQSLDDPQDFYGLNCLSISRAGHALISEYRNLIEPGLVDGGKFSHATLRGAASKINMQIMKIAANLYLLESRQHGAQIPDRHIKAAIGIANALLEANLTLCRDKGLLGVKAEFSAILSLFEKDPRPRSERNIIGPCIKKKPFNEFSGNRSDQVRSVLDDMVNQRLLSRMIVEAKPMYTLSQ